MVCPKSTICWKVCWNPLAAFSRQLADFLICTYFGKKVKLASFLQIRLFHLVFFSREICPEKRARRWLRDLKGVDAAHQKMSCFLSFLLVFCLFFRLSLFFRFLLFSCLLWFLLKSDPNKPSVSCNLCHLPINDI